MMMGSLIGWYGDQILYLMAWGALIETLERVINASFPAASVPPKGIPKITTLLIQHQLLIPFTPITKGKRLGLERVSISSCHITGGCPN